jgi:polyisoprenoid-binding protein YceI
MAIPAAALTGTAWRLDPAHSRAEFHVRSFWGAVTVAGRFTRMQGTLSPSGAELTIEAESLDTGNARRDKHLKSQDFFDVERHPYIRFVAQSVGERSIRGLLHVRGASAALDIPVDVRRHGDDLELEAVTTVDQRRFGMTWNPLGLVRSPSRLVVQGRLIRD